MHKVDFEYKGVHYNGEYATKWDELTKKELLDYSDALLHYKDDELCITILHRFLKFPSEVFFSMQMHEIRDLFPTITYLFPNELSSIRLIIDEIQSRFRLCTFYGPGLNFRNMTVGEFAFADSYLLKYKQSKDVNDLNTLLAAIYRPASIAGAFRFFLKDADVRVMFNDRIAKRSAKRFRNIPEHIKKAAMFNFLSMRTYVVKTNPELFKTDGESENIFGWAGVMYNLAGSELGTLKDIQQMLLFNALTIMKKLEHDRIEMEKKFKIKKEDND